MEKVTRQDVLDAMSNTQNLFNDYRQQFKEELDSVEPEKPKLRHGDYGHDEDSGDRFVVIEQNGLFGSPKAFYANQHGQVHVNESTVSRIRLGNIFADLKALSEPLKKFVGADGMCPGLKFSFYSDGGLRIEGRSKDYVYCVNKRDISTFILNLRRLVATAEREQHG